MTESFDPKRYQRAFDVGGRATFRSEAGAIAICKDRIVYLKDEALLKFCEVMGI